MCGWGPYAREASVWEACCRHSGVTIMSWTVSRKVPQRRRTRRRRTRDEAEDEDEDEKDEEEEEEQQGLMATLSCAGICGVPQIV